MSSKRKPPSLAGRPAKESKQQPFPCPNPLCKQCYKTSRSLRMHFTKNQACADYVVPHQKPVAQNSGEDSSSSDDNIPWGNHISAWDTSDDDSDASARAFEASSCNDVGVEVPVLPKNDTDMSCNGISFTTSEKAWCP
jgi:hypothetical protein